jgi:hypothetical protein
VGTVYVDVELVARVLDVRLLDGTEEGVSGVVDEGVDTSFVVNDSFDRVPHTLIVCDVQRQRFAYIDTFGIPRCSVDAPSVRLETPRRLLTDTAGRTRDEDRPRHP